MGAQYQFVCGNCGYEAIVSGGPDLGFIAVTQTILCSMCKELFDISVGEVGGKSLEKYRCPNGRRHKVRAWNQPDVCPKCSSPMEMQMGMMVNWD